MLARKEKVVGQNNDGILYLFKKNKIAFFHGRGAFAGIQKDCVGDGGATATAPQPEVVALMNERYDAYRRIYPALQHILQGDERHNVHV